MVSVLLLAFFPILVVISVRRVEVGLLAWLLLMPFADGNLIVFGVDLRVISFDRLGFLAVLLGLLANGQLRDVLPERFSRLEKAVCALIGIFVIESLFKFPLRDAFSVCTNTFDSYCIPFALYLFIKHQLTKDGRFNHEFERKLITVLGIIVLYSAPMSIFEGLTGIDLLPAPRVDSETGFDRTNGPFWNPGVLGSYLSWISLLIFYRWRIAGLEQKASAVVTALIRIPYILMVSGGLYFVMFRNAWGGFVGACGLRYIFTLRGRLTLIAAGIVLALGLAISWDAITQTSLYQNRLSNQENIYDRLGAWLYAFRAFSEHPVLGLGTGQLPHYITSAQEVGDDLRVMDVQATYHPHNTLLALLAENGILGAASFAFVLLAFLGNVRACIRRAQTPADVEFGIYAASAAFAILAPGLTDRSFEWAKSNQLMYVIFGLIAAHRVKLETMPVTEDEPAEDVEPEPVAA